MNFSYKYLSNDGVTFHKNRLCEEITILNSNELTKLIYDLCSFQYYTGALSGKKEDVAPLIEKIEEYVIDEEINHMFYLILDSYDVAILDSNEYENIDICTRTKYEYLKEDLKELLRVCRDDELSYLAIYEDLNEASIMYLEGIGVHYDTALHILDFIDNEIMENYLGIEYIPSTGMYLHDERW